MSIIGKSLETESSLVAAWAWERKGRVERGRENEEWLLMGTRFIGDADRDFVKLDYGDGCTTL